MVIVHDTRDKPGKHRNVEEFWQQKGITVIRNKMYVGDVTLLQDQTTCIDLKQGLQEVYSNLVQDHDRFKAECIRAKDAGIQLIVLVQENGIRSLDDVKNWSNPRTERFERIKAMQKYGKWVDKQLPKRMPITSDRLSNMMKVMSERYGVWWEFCNKTETGQRILDLLGGGDG